MDRELLTFQSHMDLDYRSSNLTMPVLLKLTLAAFTVCSLSWGSLMKFIILRHFRRIKIMDKPINYLIVLDQVSFKLLGARN